MSIKQVSALRNITPFFGSFLLHLLFGISLSIFNLNETSNLRIEVQLQKSGGSKTSQRILTARPKTESATSPSAQTGSTGEVSESQNDNGNSKMAILGSEIGIHASYPRLSRVMGEKGTVQISIDNDNIRVSKSSGFLRLDESALSATREALKNGLLAENLRKEGLQIRFVFRFVE